MWVFTFYFLITAAASSVGSKSSAATSMVFRIFYEKMSTKTMIPSRVKSTKTGKSNATLFTFGYYFVIKIIKRGADVKISARGVQKHHFQLLRWGRGDLTTHPKIGFSGEIRHQTPASKKSVRIFLSKNWTEVMPSQRSPREEFKNTTFSSWGEVEVT